MSATPFRQLDQGESPRVYPIKGSSLVRRAKRDYLWLRNLLLSPMFQATDEIPVSNLQVQAVILIEFGFAPAHNAEMGIEEQRYDTGRRCSFRRT